MQLCSQKAGYAALLRNSVMGCYAPPMACYPRDTLTRSVERIMLAECDIIQGMHLANRALEITSHYERLCNGPAVHRAF